jgi:hypothetical protein
MAPRAERTESRQLRSEIRRGHQFEGATVEVLGFGAIPNYPPEPAEVALPRLRFELGGRLLVTANDPGMTLHYVEAGILTLSFRAPVVVVCGAALATPEARAQEQVPADTEFALGAGNSFVATSPSGGEWRSPRACHSEQGSGDADGQAARPPPHVAGR